MLTINNENIYMINEVARRALMGETINISFETTSLKHYFFQVIKKYDPELYIINCESSERRLVKDIKNAHDSNIIIYDNAYNIDNLENFHILDKTNIFIY
jgi:hypothetical protein